VKLLKENPEILEVIPEVEQELEVEIEDYNGEDLSNEVSRIQH
jgi:hypothetical protein